MLFYPSEEQLYLPAVMIQQGNGGGIEVKIISDKRDYGILFCTVKADKSEISGISTRGPSEI